MGNRTYLFLEDSVSHDEMCLGEKMIVPCDCGYCRMVGAYGQARGWPGYHAVGLPLTRGPARTNDFVAAALLGITAARQAARARGDLPKLVVVRDLTPSFAHGVPRYRSPSGASAAEERRSWHLLKRWHVASWPAWHDTSKSPPATAGLFEGLWINDNPRATLALFEAAARAGGPFPGQLLKYNGRTYLFLQATPPDFDMLELCFRSISGSCDCRHC